MNTSNEEAKNEGGNRAMRGTAAGLAIAFAVMLAVPAMAVTTVLDPWDSVDPNDECNLYEVYNSMYGTGYTSTNGAGSEVGLPAAHTGGMDGLFITETGILDTLASLPGTATFVARYAGYGQRFGYYTNPEGVLSGDPTTLGGGGVDGDFHHLFDVTGPLNTTAPGAIGVIGVGDFPVGFYDNAPLGGARTWYSDETRNSDGFDHMVAYWATNSDGTISTTTFIIAFEDRRNLGDMDYNDLVVEVFLAGGPTFDPPVPEPATAGLLLMGLAGAALRRRFKA